MGKRLVVKGVNYSGVAVSHETLVEIVKVGTSESLWNLATTPLGALSKGTGYKVPGNGKALSIKIKAVGSGLVAIARYDSSWNMVSVMGINVVPGMNQFDLDIPVQQGDYLLANVNNTGILDFGNGNGDYQTYTDSLTDAHPHALPFNFDIAIYV